MASPTHENLTSILDLTRADLDKVNKLILHRVGSKVALIPKMASKLVRLGGKRLRPMLTLASAKLHNYQGEHHITLAAAVEFMHTATLLHDDVVDESEMRRGSMTARLEFGNQASVLVGDYLLGQAFKMMVDVENIEALKILSGASIDIAEGEVMQLIQVQNLETTVDEYYQVISGKTATLFSAATEVGAVIVDDDQDKRKRMQIFGHTLGIAFQLVDDALDYMGDGEKLGKSVGDDFREGKLTLPVILAYQKADREEKHFWQRTVGEANYLQDDLKRAQEIINRHKVIEETISLASKELSKAADQLCIYSEGPSKRALEGLLKYCLSRTN